LVCHCPRTQKPWFFFYDKREAIQSQIELVRIEYVKWNMACACPAQSLKPSSYPLRFGQINFIRFDGHKNILLITCSFFSQNFRRLFVSMVYVVLHSAKIYQAFIRYDLDGLDHLLNHTKSKLISWFMACIRGIIS